MASSRKPILPSLAQRRRAVTYALALVDHAIRVHGDRDARAMWKESPNSGVELPIRFMREFTGIIWFLHRLQATGLASDHEPKLPTVVEALELLRVRLQGT